MSKKRVAFIVYVDLDEVPGAFHTKESAQNITRQILVDRIPHYNPLVSLAPASVQPIQNDEEINIYPRIPLAGLGLGNENSEGSTKA